MIGDISPPVTSIPGSSDLFALCICLNFNPKIIESFDLLSHKLKHEGVEFSPFSIKFEIIFLHFCLYFNNLAEMSRNLCSC
jgi:hypothetical protein